MFTTLLALLCDLLLNTFLSGPSPQKDAKTRKGLGLMFTRSSLRSFAIFCEFFNSVAKSRKGLTSCSPDLLCVSLRSSVIPSPPCIPLYTTFRCVRVFRVFRGSLSAQHETLNAQHSTLNF